MSLRRCIYLHPHLHTSSTSTSTLRYSPISTSPIHIHTHTHTQLLNNYHISPPRHHQHPHQHQHRLYSSHKSKDQGKDPEIVFVPKNSSSQSSSSSSHANQRVIIEDNNHNRHSNEQENDNYQESFLTKGINAVKKFLGFKVKSEEEKRLEHQIQGTINQLTGGGLLGSMLGSLVTSAVKNVTSQVSSMHGEINDIKYSTQYYLNQDAQIKSILGSDIECGNAIQTFTSSANINGKTKVSYKLGFPITGSGSRSGSAGTMVNVECVKDSHSFDIKKILVSCHSNGFTKIIEGGPVRKQTTIEV